MSASDAEANDEFGFSNAVQGARLLIGAPGHGNNRGAGYVLDCGVNSCTQIVLGVPPGVQRGDRFGFAVALGADRAILSAPGIDSHRGRVYVYRWSKGVWSLIQVLHSPESESNASFGHALAAEEDLLVIGSSGANDSQGAAFVFRFDGTSYQPVGSKLIGSQSQIGNRFGHSLALMGTTVLIGAPMESNGTPGSFANGAVYAYTIGSSSATPIQRIQPAGLANGARFGHALSIQPNALAIGAPLAFDRGRVYVFDWNGVTATLNDTLALAEGEQRDFLGWSVSLKGNDLLIGAPLADSTIDLADARCGAAYQSQFNGTWTSPSVLTGDWRSDNPLGGWQVLQSTHGQLIAAPKFTANNSGASAWIDTMDTVFGDDFEDAGLTRCAAPAQ